MKSYLDKEPPKRTTPFPPSIESGHIKTIHTLFWRNFDCPFSIPGVRETTES